MPKPLNVLLITTDQMRRDHMGCGGNPVIRTPNLDRLAASGVCLDRAYVSNPVCMPNRSTIATGRLPRNHGCWSNGIDLPEGERTIADLLNQRGYHTALLGKAHFRCYGHPKDEPPSGIECAMAWNAGRNDPKWTGPYYGFQYVQLSIVHGPDNLRWGHFGQWVRENFPGLQERLTERIESPTGGVQCWTPTFPPEAHCSNWLGGIGGEYLRQRAADGRPFFLWVSFPDPHHPFTPPRPYDTMHDPASVVMPKFGPEALADKPPYFRQAYEGGQSWEGIDPRDRLSQMTQPQMREIIARTYGMISLVDQNVGRLLDALDATGLADSTVVIFTSDHGDLMGDCGLVFKGPFLLEGLINVPMIWRVPGGGRGVHSSDLFSSADIVPTVLPLVVAEAPVWIDGLGQGELVAGGRGRRQGAFVEFKSMYRTELNLRTVITSDWKLTHYAGLPEGELYDMTAPVPEARNLYHVGALAEARGRLERMLLDQEVICQDRRLWPRCHA